MVEPNQHGTRTETDPSHIRAEQNIQLDNTLTDILFIEIAVHHRAKRHRSLCRDLIAGLDSRSIQLWMPEKAHIHAHCHARAKNVVAIGAKERFFGFV